MLAVLNRKSCPLWHSPPHTRARPPAKKYKSPPKLTAAAASPSSTIARSFSAELEDIFRIDNSVADLDAKLDERCVTPQATHLD